MTTHQSALLNAARIAREWPDYVPFAMSSPERIALVAQLMAEKESVAGFSWVDCVRDWETACNDVAGFVAGWPSNEPFTADDVEDILCDLMETWDEAENVICHTL